MRASKATEGAMEPELEPEKREELATDAAATWEAPETHNSSFLIASSTLAIDNLS